MATSKITSFEDGWKKIEKAVKILEEVLSNGIQSRNTRLFEPVEYMDVYAVCFNMCTQKSPYRWTHELYQKHGETIETYLKTSVLPHLLKTTEQGGEILLKELDDKWSNHQIMNKWLQKFFEYIDRMYVNNVNNRNDVPNLHQVGLNHFKKYIYDEVQGDTTNAILVLINQERDGGMFDNSVVKNIVKIFEMLDSYKTDFEEPLLVSTKEYYARKAQKWIESLSTPDYLIKAERVLNEERSRVARYLNPGSEKKLSHVCEEEILERVQNDLIEKEGSGCRVLLANEKFDDLRRMFNLFTRLENGLKPIAEIVGLFISTRGNEVIKRRQARLDSGEKDTNDDTEYVKALLELNEKCLKVIMEVFNNNHLFNKALKNSFQGIVNKKIGAYTSAELLSSYTGRILRSEVDDVDDHLDSIVRLFTYLADKDLFADIYRNQLAKRLLYQKLASHDIEKSMIAKLKIQCGPNFTSKLEGMMNDLAVGVDQRTEFQSAMNNDKPDIDFSAQVLNYGFWPSCINVDLTLPPQMKECVDIYTSWHKRRHEQRKISWMYSLGNATVKATFGKKSYDLQLTTLQAVALDALNEGKTVTLNDLADALNLEEEILMPLMHSLSCCKHKVVRKIPASNKIQKSDKFVANVKFSSNNRKIRIPMASLESRDRDSKRVQEDRAMAIEATIVRIMKARKTLLHQQLQAEVLSQLAFFKPEPRIVKRRIEALIEREYLERSAENSNVYNYLA